MGLFYPSIAILQCFTDVTTQSIGKQAKSTATSCQSFQRKRKKELNFKYCVLRKSRAFTNFGVERTECAFMFVGKI